MTLDRFIPISEAAQRMRVSVKKTRAMINSGKIKGGILPDGGMVVSEETLPKTKLPKKEDLKEYKKFAHLKGMQIGVGEASRKYKIPDQTIHRWAVKKKIIAVIRREGQKVLLNEQDVAYCAEIYYRNGGQGKTLFNPDGTPYEAKKSFSSK